MRAIQGGCHCGNITYRFRWPLANPEIPVRACSCRFCTKHHGVYTSHPEASLEAVIADDSLVSRYRFATGTAEFFVCSRCGVVPFVTSRIDGRLYAVVNTTTFDDVDPDCLIPQPTNFDGETVDSRLDRRRRSWIPSVSVEGIEAG